MTPAQSTALTRAHAARRGSGYVPQDPGAVRAVLDAIRNRAAQARRGGSPPDPRSLRSCAAAVGVSDKALRKWLSGQGWPGPAHLPALRRWLSRGDGTR